MNTFGVCVCVGSGCLRTRDVSLFIRIALVLAFFETEQYLPERVDVFAHIGGVHVSEGVNYDYNVLAVIGHYYNRKLQLLHMFTRQMAVYNP